MQIIGRTFLYSVTMVADPLRLDPDPALHLGRDTDPAQICKKYIRIKFQAAFYPYILFQYGLETVLKNKISECT